MSQTFKVVSREPEAKKSPKGWKSMLEHVDLCPVNVLMTTKKQCQVRLHSSRVCV